MIHLGLINIDNYGYIIHIIHTNTQQLCFNHFNLCKKSSVTTLCVTTNVEANSKLEKMFLLLHKQK